MKKIAFQSDKNENISKKACAPFSEELNLKNFSPQIFKKRHPFKNFNCLLYRSVKQLSLEKFLYGTEVLKKHIAFLPFIVNLHLSEKSS
jgi:hypothetical protein